jgi:hypothetical protein
MKLNKIISAFGNLDKIAEGVKNKIFKNEDVEEIAKARWLECVHCPHLDEKGDKCAIKATKPCCGKCGCSIGIKIRSLSSGCPVGKWKPVVDKKGEIAIKEQINKDASNI